MSGYFQSLIRQTGYQTASPKPVSPALEAVSQEQPLTTEAEIISEPTASSEPVMGISAKEEPHVHPAPIAPEPPIEVVTQAEPEVIDSPQSILESPAIESPIQVAQREQLESEIVVRNNPATHLDSEPPALIDEQPLIIKQTSDPVSVATAPTPLQATGLDNPDPVIIEKIASEVIEKPVHIEHTIKAQEPLRQESAHETTDRMLARSVVSPTSQPEPPPTDSAEEPLSGPALIKVVREWVGQTPAPGEQPPEPAAILEEQPSVSPTPQGPPPAGISQQTATPTLEKELSLSIGAINLTVEAPEPTTQIQPQPARQPPPKRDPFSNRLDRHYLRF